MPLSGRELCTAGLAQMDKFFPVSSHAARASASNDAWMSDAIYSGLPACTIGRPGAGATSVSGCRPKSES